MVVLVVEGVGGCPELICALTLEVLGADEGVRGLKAGEGPGEGRGGGDGGWRGWRAGGSGGVSRLEEQALNCCYIYSSFRQHI